MDRQYEPGPDDYRLRDRVVTWWTDTPSGLRQAEAWFDTEYSLDAIRARRDRTFGSPAHVAQTKRDPQCPDTYVRLLAAVEDAARAGFPWPRSKGERRRAARRILFIARLLMDPDLVWRRLRYDTTRPARSWAWRMVLAQHRDAWARLVARALDEFKPVRRDPSTAPVRWNVTADERKRLLLDLAPKAANKSALAAAVASHTGGGDVDSILRFIRRQEAGDGSFRRDLYRAIGSDARRSA